MDAATITCSGSRLTLASTRLALGFDLDNGAALATVVDPATDTDLVRDPAAPHFLWRLVLRRGREEATTILDSSRATRTDWQEEGPQELEASSSGSRLGSDWPSAAGGSVGGDLRAATPADNRKSRRSESASHIQGDRTPAAVPKSVRPATGSGLPFPGRTGATTLVLTSGGLPGGITVEVRVTLAADSALSVWHLAVRGLAADQAVVEAVCPIVTGLARLGDPAPGESLAVPDQGEGFLFRNPFPVRDGLPLCAGAGPEMAEVGLGEIGLRYPGSLPMQMFAWYNDTTGLYLACHDAGQHVKDFAMRAEAGRPVLSIAHLPGEVPGADVAIAYDIVLGVFHGDWYDAADIYKAWARQQWWCAKTLAERDLAGWLRTGVGGVFQMSNYHIPRLDLNHSLDTVAQTVNDLAESADVPLLGLVFNYEGGGAWTGPKGFWPPREGEPAFAAAMGKLRAAGNHGFVYVTGGVWYLRIAYDPPWDSSAEYAAEGAAHAVVGLDGAPVLGHWYPGWDVAWLCPHDDYLKELTADLVVGALDRGVTVVQIDNFPIGGNIPCYADDHGHPPGCGAWRNVAWGEVLAETRRRAKAKNPDCALTTEGIAECFIPWLDLYDQRAGNMEYFGHYHRGLPMGGETIPIFNYVYNPYIGSYYAAMPECNRPEVLYWTRGLGKALCQGVLPSGGRYFPDPPDHNPVTIAFYRKVVRATANELWPYLMFGELLRPPPIDVPTVAAHYCKFNYVADGTTFEHRMDPKQRHEVRDAAVQHGAFRGPDGSVALLFVNVSREPVAFAVDLEGDTVTRIDDGVRREWQGDELAMPPLSLTVLIIEGTRP